MGFHTGKWEVWDFDGFWSMISPDGPRNRWASHGGNHGVMEKSTSKGKDVSTWAEMWGDLCLFQPPKWAKCVCLKIGQIASYSHHREEGKSSHPPLELSYFFSKKVSDKTQTRSLDERPFGPMTGPVGWVAALCKPWAPMASSWIRFERKGSRKIIKRS